MVRPQDHDAVDGVALLEAEVRRGVVGPAALVVEVRRDDAHDGAVDLGRVGLLHRPLDRLAAGVGVLPHGDGGPGREGAGLVDPIPERLLHLLEGGTPQQPDPVEPAGERRELLEVAAEQPGDLLQRLVAAEVLDDLQHLRRHHHGLLGEHDRVAQRHEGLALAGDGDRLHGPQVGGVDVIGQRAGWAG